MDDIFGVTELAKTHGDEEHAHNSMEKPTVTIHESTADVPRANPAAAPVTEQTERSEHPEEVKM